MFYYNASKFIQISLIIICFLFVSISNLFSENIDSTCKELMTRLHYVLRLHSIYQKMQIGQSKRKYPQEFYSPKYFTVQLGIVDNNAYAFCFEDSEILAVHQIVRRVSNRDPNSLWLEYSVSQTGNSVVRQSLAHNSTVAASAMLILDAGLIPQKAEIFKIRDDLFFEDIPYDLRQAGLVPLSYSMKSNKSQKGKFLHELFRRLVEYGPAIVQLNILDGHVVVVNRIFETYTAGMVAEVRDPYHGWEVLVKIDALIEKINPNAVIYQALRKR